MFRGIIAVFTTLCITAHCSCVQKVGKKWTLVTVFELSTRQRMDEEQPVRPLLYFPALDNFDTNAVLSSVSSAIFFSLEPICLPALTSPAANAHISQISAYCQMTQEKAPSLADRTSRFKSFALLLQALLVTLALAIRKKSSGVS